MYFIDEPLVNLAKRVLHTFSVHTGCGRVGGVVLVGTPERRRGTRRGADRVMEMGVLNNACLVF